MSLHISNTLSKIVSELLKQLAASPNLLHKDMSTLSEIKKKLRSQGDVNSQGTGNQVTDQETCFAALLEEHGVQYSYDVPSTDGVYYIYQLNGTQRSIDFQVFHLVDGIKQSSLNFDLKHTKNDIFFLNDGWFHQNIIYVISWMRRTSPPRKKKVVEAATFIAFGQKIPTEDESALHEELCEIKKKYNTDYKGVGSFHCYLRFANTYKCDRFTPEYSTECLLDILSRIAKKRPKASQSVTDITEKIEMISLLEK